MIELVFILLMLLMVIGSTHAIMVYNPDTECPEELPAPPECAKQVLLTVSS